MERWVGRVALVTGASSGIGAAICKQLVDAGMKVVGAARNEEKIKALAKELENKPGSLTAFKLDISKDDEVMSLFAFIKEQFGGVDVCINNAGFSHNHNLLEGTTKEWREMLDVNVVGLCLCTREAVASMRERNVDDGQIIHISSVCGHTVAYPSEFNFYTATKHAVTALIEGLRKELREAKSHIRVGAISPATVRTEFFERMTKDKALSEQLFFTFDPLQSDDIASSLMYILSAPPHVQVHDILLRATEQLI